MLVNLTIPIARIETDLINDPECRIGVAIYVAGCARRCDECQNPGLRNPENGTLWSLEDLMLYLCDDHGLWESIVFLGGDWVLYPKQYEYIAAAAWEDLHLESVLYTGEVLENLPHEILSWPAWIIDGSYDKKQKGIYPASNNQRVFHNGEQVDPTTLPLYKKLVGEEQKHIGTST